jgi:chromatin segregation and condensation protein Rec8/ScpA/Scc1 (kleisin family)
MDLDQFDNDEPDDELRHLQEEHPQYKLFSKYVHLYNDGKKDSELIKPVLNELKALSPEDKYEILELFRAKIHRMKEKDGRIQNKTGDVEYYKKMEEHFKEYCI